MSGMAGVRFVKIVNDWVNPREVVAVERRPGGGARIHLKSGGSLAYGESITPDDVVQTMFAAEVRSTNTTEGES